MTQVSKFTKKYDLWICSLLLTSILTLSHIRMYGHDTNGWMLPARTWFVDMLRQSDVPFWFGVVKYGFPTTIVQFVGTFWSPYAIILAMFGDYTARTLASEFFLWRLTALLGAYWLARMHFVLKSDAVVTSAIFIGSGTFASQDAQLGLYAGMAVVPWIIGGIDRCICGRTNRTRLLGSGVLGISGAVILWSGYPGIWILLPFLLAPYVLLSIIFSQSQHSRILSFVFLTIGTFVAIVCFIPVIVETIFFPIFGNTYRNIIDPNVGLLNILGLTGFMFVNPSYLNPINAMPVYVGIIPFIAILIYFTKTIYLAISKHIESFEIFTHLIIITIVIYSYIYSIIFPINLIVICVIFFRVGSLSIVKYKRSDAIYLIAISWIVFWSTSGPMQNALRPVLPPLSMVRWFNTQMYLADLFIIIFSWSIIKRLKLSKENRKLLFVKCFDISVLIIVLSYIFISNIKQIIDQLGKEPDKLGAIPLVWTLGCLLVTILIIIYYIIVNSTDRVKYEISRFGTIVALSFTVSLPILLSAYFYNDNTPKWWDTLIELPKGMNLLLDMIHLLIFTLCFVGVSFLKSRKIYISTLALLCVLDTSLASARYLGEAEMMNVGGNRAGPTSVDTSVNGNERSMAGSDGIVWLASTAPHMWAYPGTVPMAASVDKAWGEPSMFRNFAVFPLSWRYNDNNEITVDEENLRFGNENINKCIIEDRMPIVNIEKFLSSQIQVSIQTKCDRVLIWTDTWARGWSAEVNGRPATIHRVNSAIRGVEIKRGTVELTWTYRPEQYFISYICCFIGVCCSWFAIFIGLRGETDGSKILM